MKDITDKEIKKAMAAFGSQVKAQAAARQDVVIGKLREEIARLKPQMKRLLHGKT
jgi:uncharacterized small protein (DUF1192 family)